MTDRQEGEYDKRKVAGAMAFGTMFLAILAIMVLSVGMVGANLGVGMGGFIASFEQVNNVADEERLIAPALGENPACGSAPQLVASFPGDTSIRGDIAFYKDLPLPSNFTSDDNARVSIYSPNPDGIKVQELDLRMSALEADNLLLGNGSQNDVEIGEHSVEDEDGSGANASYTSPSDPSAGDAEFDIQITPQAEVNITNGTAAAHQIAFGELDLPDIEIAVQIGNNTEFEDEDQPTSRVIQPSNRTCESLAEASAPSNWPN